MLCCIFRVFKGQRGGPPPYRFSGLQEADKDSLNTASPTVDRGVWRMMVVLRAVYGWVPYCFDISTAFLQGRQITRDVFLRPPAEIGEPGMVIKLNKSVYGLVDAPLQPSEALNEGIVAIGGVRLPYDKCAWMWYADDSSLLAMLCAHVDDLYCSADPSFEELLLVKLRALFPVATEKRRDFIYCGLQVSTDQRINRHTSTRLFQWRSLKLLDHRIAVLNNKNTEIIGELWEHCSRCQPQRVLTMHTEYLNRLKHQQGETRYSSKQVIEYREKTNSGITVSTTERRATAHWIS